MTWHAYREPIELGCCCQLCVAVKCSTEDAGNVENLSNHFVNTLHNFLSDARYTRMTEEVLSARHYHPTSHEWRSPDWYEEHKRPVKWPNTFTFSRPNHVFFHFAADYHFMPFLRVTTPSLQSGNIPVHSNIISPSRSKWERDEYQWAVLKRFSKVSSSFEFLISNDSSVISTFWQNTEVKVNSIN